MNIFDEIKYLYIQEIGEVPDDSRQARMVEMRSALSNAMVPYCRYDDIARLWNRDRTTIYNAISKHPAYMMTSRDYQHWYAVAVQVVDAKLNDIPPSQVNLEGNLNQRTHEQIDNVAKTIRYLQDFKARLEKRLRPNKSRTLSSLRERGLGDDAGRMGKAEVHRVLRDEQLQVPDEGGQQAEQHSGERLGESEVVRG